MLGRKWQLFGRKRNGILISDSFNGAALDKRWTAVDAESKITVSEGSLRISGGLATPAWTDPSIIWTTGIPHRPGLLIRVHWRAATLNYQSLNVESTALIGDPSAALYSWVCNDTNVRAYMAGSLQGDGLYALADATDYWAAMRFGAGDCLWLVSTDDGITYIPVWYESSGGNTGTLYVGMVNYNSTTFYSEKIEVRYAAAPAPTIYQTALADPTPATGSELLTNGNMETGDPPSSWTAAASATLDGVADERTGGTGAQSLSIKSAVGVGGYGEAYQAVTLVTGQWYQHSLWGRKVDGNLRARVWNQSAGSTMQDITFSSTSWGVSSALPLRASGTNGRLRLLVDSANDSLECRADDDSLKALTWASCLILAGDPGTREGLFDATPTVTAGTGAGIAIGVDDETNPANLIVAYHDGSANAHLDKLVNGVLTVLINTAATYSAGATIRIQSIGTTYNLTYNGAAVGTTQTISDTSFGTKVCGYSNYGSNTAGVITCYTRR